MEDCPRKLKASELQLKDNLEGLEELASSTNYCPFSLSLPLTLKMLLICRVRKNWRQERAHRNKGG